MLAQAVGVAVATARRRAGSSILGFKSEGMFRAGSCARGVLHGGRCVVHSEILVPGQS